MNKIELYLKSLDLPPSATWEEVMAAYRQLIKVWHPDRFDKDEALRARAEEKSKELNEALRSLRPHFRKTSVIKRGKNPAEQVNKPGPWSAFKNSTIKDSAVFQGSKGDAGVYRKLNRQRRLVSRVMTLALYSSVLMSIGLIAAIGFPAPSRTKMMPLSANNFPTRTMSDYRLVANVKPVREEVPIVSHFQPTSKPLLVEKAASCDMIALRSLLGQGGDVNVSDLAGNTPLAWAAQTNCVPGAKLLLQHGANPTSISNNGFTPKDWASRAGNHKIVAILMEAVKTKSVAKK